MHRRRLHIDLDRLLRHSQVTTIRGDSYCRREKRGSG